MINKRWCKQHFPYSGSDEKWGQSEPSMQVHTQTSRIAADRSTELTEQRGHEEHQFRQYAMVQNSYLMPRKNRPRGY